MTTLLILLAGSCGLCLLLTPVARALAAWSGLLDRPDGRRKLHARVMPLAGGLAIYVSCASALTAAFLISNPLREELATQGRGLLGLLLAGAIICLVGVADDYGYLRGRHKLCGQLLAIAVLLHFGVVVSSVHVFGWEIELGLLAVPCTVLWLLGAINSLNLIDGMDGLLSSVGLIVTLALTAMAVLAEQWAAACVAVALAGALLGFLRYNFPPASIFLGDCGSMLIGLAVGTLAIQSSLKGPATVALAAPLALLTVPFFDTLAAIIRRKLTGRSIYTTDRAHLHHCLLRHGFSNRQVLLSVSLFCLLAVFGVLSSLALRNELFAVLAAVMVVGIMIATRLFGHTEMMLLGRLLLTHANSYWPRRRGSSARQIMVRLQGSANWQELWEELLGCACRLNVVMLRLNVNAPAIQEGYHACWDCRGKESEETPLWRTEVALMAGGQSLGRLEIWGRQNGQPARQAMAEAVELVEYLEDALLVLLGKRLVPFPGDAGEERPHRHSPLPAPHRYRLARIPRRGEAEEASPARGNETEEVLG